MRVVSMPDIIHVLELHLETSETAGIVLDLLDYVFELETSEEGASNVIILGGMESLMIALDQYVGLNQRILDWRINEGSYKQRLWRGLVYMERPKNGVR